MREEREEFRIVLEEKSEIQFMFEPGAGDRIWRWIRRGTERILNLSTVGLASAADKIRGQLETKLGGTWQVSQISLTISSNPSATITIQRKP